MLPLLLACSDDGFYTDPVEDLASYEPGDVLRFEHIAQVSALSIQWKAGVQTDRGAEVYRLLYRTEGVTGEADMASARLALPDDAQFGDALPLVAHLHGTLGLADACAPSRDGGFGFESASNPHAARMISQGRAVIAPDFLGLGPPGPHPYTASGPAATSVLDAIRAVTRFSDPEHGVALGQPPAIALEGHSQGAHAGLATLAYVDSYAPELELAGAVLLAAPGAPRELLQHIALEDRYAGFIALALLGLGAAGASVGEPEDWLRDDYAADLPERVEEDCLAGLSDIVGAPLEELFRSQYAEAMLAGDFERIDLTEALDHEDLSGLITDVPALFVHGSDDDLLPLELTAALVEDLRAAGSAAELLVADGGDHLFLPWTAREEVWRFLDQVL